VVKVGSTSSVVHSELAPVHGLPANVTFLDLIRRNKRKSVALMIGMGMLVVVLGAALAAAIAVYGGGVEALIPSLVLGAAVALVIAVIACLWSFYSGSEAILRMSIAGRLPCRTAGPRASGG